MAIKKISRIQHRRGLKSDLPPKLHEGEFGWCVDTRELFIGNSDATPNNSQILTQWTNNDQIIQHTYQGYSGVTSSNVVTRSIGNKLDDFLTVRDFGAVGDGVADDYNAIQNAIIDRYGTAAAGDKSPTSGYVVLYIPAGTYRISQPLKLYPFVRLQGEGSKSTKIVLDNVSALCVVQTADSDGNIFDNIGLDSARLPDNIEIHDIWLDQPNLSGDVILLQRASNVKIQSVTISGPRQNASNVEANTNGVNVQSLGGVFVPHNIVVQNCDIYGMGHAVHVNDPVTALKIALSDIHNCWYGITLGDFPNLGGPYMPKVIGNTFTNVESHGISCLGSNPGVCSNGNDFQDVGVYYNVSPVFFGPASTGCSSIGDQFNFTVPNDIKLVDNQNPEMNIVVNPQKFSVAVSTPDLMGPIVLNNNFPLVPQQTILAFDPDVYNNVIITYSLNRDTNKRTGKLTLLTDGTNSILEDEYVTLGVDLGVTFGCSIISGNIVVTYNTTNTGSNATMLYTVSKWLS